MVDKLRTNHLKKTVKHSAIYAVGTIVRRITGFVMLPIYTRYLTPADYGTVELLTMAIEIVSILIGLRISQALFRYYVMAEEDHAKDVIVSTVLITVMVGSSIGLAVLYSAAEPISLAIFGHTDYSNELRLFSFTLLINAVTATCLSYLRVQQKPVLFVSINIAYLIVQVIFNIIFVVLLQLHVLGVIYSALASGVIMSLFLLIYTVTKVGIHFSLITAKDLIKFTMPLMLASLGLLYANYVDKYLLRVFGSLADVGLYALAFRLSSVIYIVFEAFNMSWAVERFEVVKQKNAQEIFSRVFRYLSAVLLMMGCGLAMFAQDVLWIMTAPEFYAAGPVVPILTLAIIIRIFCVFNNLGIILSEKTKYIAGGSWLKAVTASICYISLIPFLGVYGAAIGLVIGNLAEFAWVRRHSQRLYDMGLQWRPVMLMGFFTVICVSLGLSLPSNEILYFFARVALFLFLMFIMYRLPIWSDSERDVIWGTIKRHLNFVGKLRA